MPVMRRALDPERRTAWFGGGDPYLTGAIPPNSYAGGSSAGVAVTERTSLELTDAYACISLLEDDISTLPIDTFRRGDLERRPISPPAIITEPDAEIEQWEWVARVVGSLATAGNAYGYLHDRDRRGYPSQCKIIPPRDCKLQRNRNTNAIELRVRSAELGNVILQAEEFLHIPLVVIPGRLDGLSPIESSRRTIGISIATENFGAQWFGDGAHPSSVFESDQEVSDEYAQKVVARFLASGQGRRRPAFFGGGLKWTSTQISPNESQFLETRKLNTEQVARIWRVPPHMIGNISNHASQGGGKGIEDQAIGYVVHTLGPYMTRIERALSSKKVSPQGQYAKFNVGALLRGDTVNRYTSYAIARQWGWMSVNDIRRLEDQEPLAEGGDTYLQPLNMVDAQKALQVLIDNANNTGPPPGAA